MEKLAHRAPRYLHRIYFVRFGAELSSSQYKSLVRTGGAEWISADTDVQEILDFISNQQTRRRTQATSASSGDSQRVAVSFVPSAGGVGNATLAVEVGVSLKTSKPTKDRNICIVDLDFQSS